MQKIWGNNIAALKGKTTKQKINIVAWDQVNIPLVLIKLYKEAFFTCDIFFMKKISYFLTPHRVPTREDTNKYGHIK